MSRNIDQRGACRSRGWLWLLCALMALAVPAPASVAPYRFDAWQTEDGLPQNSITTIAQTQDGYLWLGTYQGLVRFDGVRFKVFDLSNTPELKSDRVTKLHVDPTGSLWIGTEGGGLTSYRDGRFTKYFSSQGRTDETVSAVHTDRDGTLWVGTVSGRLNQFVEGEFVPHNLLSDLPGNGVTSIVEGAGGKLWLATPEFFGYFQDGEFVPARNEPGRQLQLGKSRDGNMWLTVGNHLYKFKERQMLQDHGEFINPKGVVRVTTLFEDSLGNLWIGTYGDGLVRFKDGVFERYSTKEGLSNDIILSLYEDTEGNLWVGTHGGGLNRIRRRQFHVYDSASGLSENVVLSICEDSSGAIWIGTDGGGLNRLKDGEWKVFNRQNGLENEHVWSVFEDSKCNIWVGTWGGGLYRYSDGEFTRFGKRNGLPSQMVRALYEDSKGAIWIGTYDMGLCRLHNDRMQYFNVRNGFPSNDIRAILEDKEGNLWVGTGGGGLVCVTNRTPVTYTMEHGLPSNFIRTLYEDKLGYLWIGTGSGLSRYKDGEFSKFTTKQGLADNVISQIFEDEEGNLWLGSNRGIMRVGKHALDDVAQGKAETVFCVTYDKSDGLNARECNGGFQPSGARTRDGNFWFPTLKGAAVVSPGTILANPKPPSVVIEEVLIDGQLVSHGDLHRVAPGKERYEFHYTGISLSAPRRVKFKYRLEGYDSDWVDAGTRRAAYYSHIPPGEYRFRVIAGNSDGVWNEIGQSLKLTIIPPFWQTWWFIGAMGLILAGSTTGAVRYLSLKKLQRQLEILKQQQVLARERERIAKDLHDDLGANLTRVGLLSELAKRDAGNPQRIQEISSKISGTTRELAHTLDEIVWAVNPKNDTLNRLVAYMLHYAEEFFEITPILCRMDVQADLPEWPVSTDVRHDLFMVFKESLNNIVKYAQATEVWIRIAFADGRLKIAIEDNGKGFDATKVSVTGNGLGNMKKRVEGVGGSFELATEIDKGTRIRVEIPLAAGKK